jgi:hypothetical protein
MHMPCDCTERPARDATRARPGLKGPPAPVPPRPPLPCTCVSCALCVAASAGGDTRGRGRREKERSRAVSHTPELDAPGDLYDFGACNNMSLQTTHTITHKT